MPSDELDPIRAAVQGLEYPSERDAPFDVFCWKGDPSAGDALAQVQQRAGARAVAEVPVEDFFSMLKDSEDAERFRQLRKALESAMGSFRVFRTGEGQRRVDIHLIGQTSAGDWAGVHTVSVET